MLYLRMCWREVANCSLLPMKAYRWTVFNITEQHWGSGCKQHWGSSAHFRSAIFLPCSLCTPVSSSAFSGRVAFSPLAPGWVSTPPGWNMKAPNKCKADHEHNWTRQLWGKIRPEWFLTFFQVSNPQLGDPLKWSETADWFHFSLTHLKDKYVNKWGAC